jgi:hypothetical protein
MHSFVVAAAYTPYLGYVWLSGGVHGFSALYPFGLKDPVGTLRNLGWIANLVSVFMAVMVVLAAFDTAKALWGQGTGILAAIFAMVSFPMFFYSRTGNVDMTLLAFCAAGLAAFARILSGGFTVRRAVWLGVFAGLAMGTKEAALGFFLPVPLVLLLVYGRCRPSSEAGKGFWRAALTSAGAFVLAFGLGSGLFISPSRYFAHVRFIRGVLAEASAGKLELLQSFPNTLHGNLDLAALCAYYLGQSLTVPGLLLALFGIGVAIWREPVRSTAVLGGITSMIMAAFVMSRVVEIRFLMPTSYVLCLFAARGVASFWRFPHWTARSAAAVCVAAVSGLGLLHGADLTHLMLNDSRYAAADWLGRHMHTGDTAGTFGPETNLPPLKSGVHTVQPRRFLGLTRGTIVDDSAAGEVAAAIGEQHSAYLIVMPDYTSRPGLLHSGTCPPAIYRALLDGSLGYREAAVFHTEPLPGWSWTRRPEPTLVRRDATVTVNPPIHIFEYMGLRTRQTYEPPAPSTP